MKITRGLVEGIHQKGGTTLTSSRGPVDNDCAVDNLIARGINILFTVGGDGGLIGRWTNSVEIGSVTGVAQ